MGPLTSWLPNQLPTACECHPSRLRSPSLRAMAGKPTTRRPAARPTFALILNACRVTEKSTHKPTSSQPASGA
eukprot:scaffold4916_cov371-Prasinococcus_capsulatus_cf.AAC.7